MPSPDPIDVHVGLRIRQRRVLLGMSMETLGAAVGLSFQMVQKYEVGINSIAASRLVEVAKALDVPPSFFFEGPHPRAKDDVVHTRDHGPGPRVHDDFQFERKTQHCRDDPGNCHNTSIAPPRCLSAKACAPCGPKPLGAGPGRPGCWPTKGFRKLEGAAGSKANYAGSIRTSRLGPVQSSSVCRFGLDRTAHLTAASVCVPLPWSRCRFATLPDARPRGPIAQDDQGQSMRGLESAAKKLCHSS